MDWCSRDHLFPGWEATLLHNRYSLLSTLKEAGLEHRGTWDPWLVKLWSELGRLRSSVISPFTSFQTKYEVVMKINFRTSFLSRWKTSMYISYQTLWTSPGESTAPVLVSSFKKVSIQPSVYPESMAFSPQEIFTHHSLAQKSLLWNWVFPFSLGLPQTFVCISIMALLSFYLS